MKRFGDQELHIVLLDWHHQEINESSLATNECFADKHKQLMDL